MDSDPSVFAHCSLRCRRLLRLQSRSYVAAARWSSGALASGWMAGGRGWSCAAGSATWPRGWWRRAGSHRRRQARAAGGTACGGATRGGGVGRRRRRGTTTAVAGGRRRERASGCGSRSVSHRPGRRG
ncbi:hypothetical protein BS78_07G208000 [Paspalum vaginatum]|nr:hypothetical protein BS78_07G208000 [Paspalum vaginatum]